jgi:hypothetical protein
MKKTTIRTVASILAVGVAVLACSDETQTQASTPQEAAPAPQQPVTSTTSEVDRTIAIWPEGSRRVAHDVIAKYGDPDEVAASMLVWYQRGPWKRTILHRDEIPHRFPAPHTDLLEQFVDYRVPVDKYSDLARYDGSVIVERTKGEISARCDLEEANFLALNLANDVATGTSTAEQARQAYADILAAKKTSGRSHPYLEGLRFTPQTGTADSDMPLAPSAGPP